MPFETYRPSRASYLRAPLQRRHYRAALGIARTIRRPASFLWRYVTGRGGHPSTVVARTPIGPVRLTTFDPVDLQTINEIFCRLDYGSDVSPRAVVDIGSNIGVSAAWFLSRNPECRVWCYEPVAQNVERLRHNLAPFEGRWSLEEVAVAARSGEVEFGVEPTGRYGGLRAPDDWQKVTVTCRGINDVLRDVLDEVDRIDILKLDTENLEPETVGAIDEDLVGRIGLIMYESDRPKPVRSDLYDAEHDGVMNRLRPRAAAGRTSPDRSRI